MKEVNHIKFKDQDPFWSANERACDVENISQAFTLFKSAETPKERKMYASFIKTIMKDLNGLNGSRPIVWKKEWDYID